MIHWKEHAGLVALDPSPFHSCEGLVKGCWPFLSGWVEREWEQHSEQFTPPCRWPGQQLSLRTIPRPMPLSPTRPLVVPEGGLSVALHSQCSWVGEAV